MTTYVVLLPGDEAIWAKSTEEEKKTVYGRHEEFSKALAERGHRVTGGMELAHSSEARVVRRGEGGLAITAGPYAETVEQLTGFYIIESDDLDDLLDCAGMLADVEAGVEVRAAAANPDAS